MKKPRATDAQFRYVSGPMRPGDEHPARPGWRFTGKRNSLGYWLWYKPAKPFWRWVRRIAWTAYFLAMAVAVLSTFGEG